MILKRKIKGFAKCGHSFERMPNNCVSQQKLHQHPLTATSLKRDLYSLGMDIKKYCSSWPHVHRRGYGGNWLAHQLSAYQVVTRKIQKLQIYAQAGTTQHVFKAIRFQLPILTWYLVIIKVPYISSKGLFQNVVKLKYKTTRWKFVGTQNIQRVCLSQRRLTNHKEKDVSLWVVTTLVTGRSQWDTRHLLHTVIK